MKHYETFLQNGQNIFDTYCRTDEEDKHPIMLPRAPHQKYIDRYPDQDLPGQSFKDDRVQQQNYEAEVKFYRVLENLEENFIVLHNFEYTHYQYHLGDKSHDKNKCGKCKKVSANNEGECDFVVVDSNYFAIFEVKNASYIKEHAAPIDGTDQKKQLPGFQKSLAQRKKMAELIKRFSNRLTVLQFSVYPNLKKIYNKEFKLSVDEKVSIIFEEDIHTLTDWIDWWKNNVSDLILPLYPKFQTIHEEVRNFLLAVWCTDNKGKCDSAKFSLGRCIMDIDEKLRSAEFTFRENNPDVITNPSKVTDFMGIKNFTKQQYDLIISNEHFCWVNGPAGTGKSVVLLEKMFNLATENDENKIILIGGTTHHDYQKILENTSIKVAVISFAEDEKVDEIRSKIEECFRNHQVAILSKSFTQSGTERLVFPNYNKLFRSLPGVNVFIDDFQYVFGWIDDFNVLVGFLRISQMISASNYVFVTYDIMQGCLNYTDKELHTKLINLLKDRVPSGQLYSLTKIMRNTFDLSIDLAKIRGIISEELFDKSEIVLPCQQPGHFIHGPKTAVHVFNNFDEENIKLIFNKEFRRITYRTDNTAEVPDVGLIHTYFDNGTLHLVEDLEMNINDGKLFSFADQTYSKEWPSVIVLHTIPHRSQWNCKMLYLAMSRARVKCTVIMYPLMGMILDHEAIYFTSTLLSKLEDSVRVTRYQFIPKTFKPRMIPNDKSKLEEYFKETTSYCEEFYRKRNQNVYK